MSDKNDKLASIDHNMIEFCGWQYIDKNCCTFTYNNNYYKGIYHCCSQWLKDKFTNRLLRKMYENKFIPLTEEAPLTLQGFYKIFHQDSEYFKFGLWHTNMQSLKESAILWLNFNKWLYKRGLGLIDGHCDNIIFVDAMRPVWCDIGSIVPVDGDSPFLGIEQFIRYYIYPLKLYEKNPLLGDISKKYLHSGMSHNIAASLGIMLPSLPNNREALLDFLKEEIESICLSPIKGQWSSYYGDDTLELDSSDTQSHRVSMFCRFIKILKPKSVVDIGANTGRFSRYCARKGAEVLAIEPDEQANFKHLAILRRKQFEGKIKLVQGDIRVDAGQPGELAIALALTHHLFFTCQYSWKYIANLLASRCTRYLLTEFMPWGLRIDAPPEDLPSHYNLQLFVEQLERYFHKVEVLSYTVPAGTSPRVFILCTEKREVPIDDGWDKFPLEERMSIMAVVDGKNVLHQAG